MVAFIEMETEEEKSEKSDNVLDQQRRKQREWKKNNQEHIKERNRLYRLRNKDKIHQYDKQYRLDNKEYIQEKREEQIFCDVCHKMIQKQHQARHNRSKYHTFLSKPIEHED